MTSTVTYQIHIEVEGDVPEDVQVLDTPMMIQNVLAAVRSSDIEDDAYTRVVGVRVERVGVTS